MAIMGYGKTLPLDENFMNFFDTLMKINFVLK
jgi:hypothetical protein